MFWNWLSFVGTFVGGGFDKDGVGDCNMWTYYIIMYMILQLIHKMIEAICFKTRIFAVQCLVQAWSKAMFRPQNPSFLSSSWKFWAGLPHMVWKISLGRTTTRRKLWLFTLILGQGPWRVVSTHLWRSQPFTLPFTLIFRRADCWIFHFEDIFHWVKTGTFSTLVRVPKK